MSDSYFIVSIIAIVSPAFGLVSVALFVVLVFDFVARVIAAGYTYNGPHKHVGIERRSAEPAAEPEPLDESYVKALERQVQEPDYIGHAAFPEWPPVSLFVPMKAPELPPEAKGRIDPGDWEAFKADVEKHDHTLSGIDKILWERPRSALILLLLVPGSGFSVMIVYYQWWKLHQARLNQVKEAVEKLNRMTMINSANTSSRTSVKLMSPLQPKRVAPDKWQLEMMRNHRHDGLTAEGHREMARFSRMNAQLEKEAIAQGSRGPPTVIICQWTPDSNV